MLQNSFVDHILNSSPIGKITIEIKKKYNKHQELSCKTISKWFNC